VPTCLALAAGVLAFGSLALDQALDRKMLTGLGWVYTGGPEGARGVLSAIAGSMITVAGVVFSITIVVLSLTSQQFGPRLLRNFMKDQSTQLVLGTFVATFLYSLLVLRTVRGTNFDEFVPHVSVTLAVALAIASVGVLIFFIHHVSRSIQADHVIAAAHSELKATIDRLFPAEIGDEPPGADEGPESQIAAARRAGKACPVRSIHEGYLQAIDAESIIRLATDQDALVEIKVSPGDYVLKGQVLAYVWLLDAKDDFLGTMGKSFVIGAARTTRQDSRFAVQQLVEVALRALSPGVNDPFTAIACIDLLASALATLAQRQIPSPYRLDNNGQLRVIANPDSFAGIAQSAFAQIRHFGRENATVTCCLLDGIGVIGRHAKRTTDVEYLKELTNSVAGEALDALNQEGDRTAISLAMQRTLAVLTARPRM